MRTTSFNEDNIFDGGALYAWANYNPWAAWTEAVTGGEE